MFAFFFCIFTGGCCSHSQTNCKNNGCCDVAAALRGRKCFQKNFPRYFFHSLLFFPLRMVNIPPGTVSTLNCEKDVFQKEPTKVFHNSGVTQKLLSLLHQYNFPQVTFHSLLILYMFLILLFAFISTEPGLGFLCR